MIYLLDTNVLADAMAGQPLVREWLRHLPPETAASTCTITRGEILFGIAKLEPGRRQRDLQHLAARIFSEIPCLPVPVAAADHYSAIKAARKRAGRPILENDCWIAATALAVGATLVTRDRDFAGIDNLQVAHPEPP